MHTRLTELFLSQVKYEQSPFNKPCDGLKAPPPSAPFIHANIHPTTYHYSHIWSTRDCSTHLELIIVKSQPGMTEWDFRQCVHEAPTAPNVSGNPQSFFFFFNLRARNKYVKIIMSGKEKVREKKEVAHLSVRLYFLLSLVVSCCLAGYVCGEI